MTKKLILACALFVAFIFKETAVFLVIAMAPTLAVVGIDKTIGKSKTICVACMNFAGAFPFLLKFWTEFGEQTVINALRLAADVQNLIIIYLLAAGGYAIDLAVTGITSSLIIQRSEARLKKVRKEQEELVERWGEKVTGRYKLDDYGFPVKPIPDKKAPKPSEDEDS